MPRKKLTDRFIRGARCPEGRPQIDYGDESVPGLSLRVTTHDKKVFTLRYQVKGKRKRFTIGEFGDLPHQILLKDARSRAAEILVDVAKGDDPGEVRDAARSGAKPLSTVNDAIELYLARLRRRGRRESYLYDITMRMQRHVVPAIGDKAIEELSPADISAVLRPLELAGKATTHNRLLTMIRPLFQIAKVNDPTKEIEKLPEELKEDWFTLQQLARIWIALEHLDAKIHPITRWAVRLGMLTLKRAGEVAGAMIDEFNEDVWHIPASRMKGRRPEVVPLSEQALEIISEAKNYPARRTDCERYLFPSLTLPDRSIARNAMSRAFPRARRIAGLTDHGGTLHSLRHSGATILATNGTSPFVISALLSHSMASAGVSQITSRYNMYDLLEERRDALEKWGEMLSMAVELERNNSRARDAKVAIKTADFDAFSVAAE